VSDENSRSSICHVLLSQVLTDKKTRLFHQPVSYKQSRMDLGLYMEVKELHWEPILFFEFTMGTLENKFTEVRAYAVNFWQQLGPGRWTIPLAVVMNVSDVPRFQVLAFPLVGDEQVATVSVLPSIVATPCTLAALIQCLQWWKDKVALQIEAKDCQIYSEPNPRVFFRENMVYKYIALGRAEMPIRYLGARSFRFVPDWYYFPKIEGSHQPQSTRQFAQVLRQLAGLHSAHPPVAHGDIRLSNIIFGKSSSLIDFDLSGQIGVCQYPEDFNPDIDDGMRHPEALPNKLLQSHHDRFSMAYIMKLFSCDQKDQWNKAIQQVEAKDSLLSVAELLDQIDGAIALSGVGDEATIPLPFQNHTGSPPRPLKNQTLSQ